MESSQWAAFSCRREVEELAAGLLESPTKQLSSGIKSQTVLVCQEKPSGLWAAPINANVLLSREAKQQPAHFRAAAAGGRGKPGPRCAWARAGRTPPQVCSTAAMSCHGDPSHQEQLG